MWRIYLDLDAFCERRVIAFIDNWAALDVAVEGTASVKQWRDLLLTLEDPSERAPTLSWFAKVEPGDGPSRRDIKIMSALYASRVFPACPLTRQPIPKLG